MTRRGLVWWLDAMFVAMVLVPLEILWGQPPEWHDCHQARVKEKASRQEMLDALAKMEFMPPIKPGGCT